MKLLAHFFSPSDFPSEFEEEDDHDGRVENIEEAVGKFSYISVLLEKE